VQAEPEPEVSVIVASHRSAGTIRRCLESLENQETAASFEVIVVDSGDDAASDIIREEFPNVILITQPIRSFPGSARNTGIARSRGEILAFIDSDCLAAPDWMEAIRETQRECSALIGGTIDNGNPNSYWGWAIYFVEFHRWMANSPAQRVSDLPTCCMCMRREIFDRFGPFREHGYCSDTAFCWKAGAAGVPIWLNPKLKICHINIDSPVAVMEKLFRHGRHFAWMRVHEQQFSGARRLLHATGALFLPFVLSARLIRHVVLTARRYRRRCFVALPGITAGLVMWSVGEMLGYLDESV